MAAACARPDDWSTSKRIPLFTTQNWLAGTPISCISNWSPFPPRTRELQLDEKWAFVYKKQAQCDLEDQQDHTASDCWDHVAFDPEHRLVLGVVFGKRSATRIKPHPVLPDNRKVILPS